MTGKHLQGKMMIINSYSIWFYGVDTDRFQCGECFVFNTQTFMSSAFFPDSRGYFSYLFHVSGGDSKSTFFEGKLIDCFKSGD